MHSPLKRSNEPTLKKTCVVFLLIRLAGGVELERKTNRLAQYEIDPG